MTNILRYCERGCYNKSPETYKKDIKRTGNILNEVINKSSKMTNKQEIADGFNDVFVNIGPELARNIVPSENLNI